MGLLGRAQRSWRVQLPKCGDSKSQILHAQWLLGPYTMIFGYLDPWGKPQTARSLRKISARGEHDSGGSGSGSGSGRK